MKKSSLFISTILTAFMLTVAAGAVTAYRAFSAGAVQPVQTSSAAQTAQNLLSPEQAAQLAAQYWGRNDLYSVESTLVNGMDAYKVTFSSGDVVFVSTEGMVLGAVAAPRVAPNNGLSFQSSQPSFQFFDDDHDHEGNDD